MAGIYWKNLNDFRPLIRRQIPPHPTIALFPSLSARFQGTACSGLPKGDFLPSKSIFLS
jgi:hypothetical protein